MIMIMQTAYPVVWTAMVVTPEGATLLQNMREPDSAFQACSDTRVCGVCACVWWDNHNVQTAIFSFKK